MFDSITIYNIFYFFIGIAVGLGFVLLMKVLLKLNKALDIYLEKNSQNKD